MPPVQGTTIRGGGVDMNPTGADGFGGVMPSWGSGTPTFTSPSWSFNPTPTGGAGNYNYGTSGNPNPTGVPGFGPTTSMTPGTTTPGGATPTVDPKAFSHTFGSGIAPFLASILNTQGGYNAALTQQDVAAQVAQMQQEAQTGFGNLVTSEGAAGISPNSSVAALEAGDYWSKVITGENAITAQEYFNMWNQSQNREFGLLGEELGPLSHNRGGALQWFDQFSQDVGALLGGSSYTGSTDSGGSYTIG